MALETWLAFLLASTVLLAIPGPTILLVIGQSLGAGRGRALPLVTGVALGDLTAMTFSLAGLGALLAASSLAFMLLKWCGAAYLVWLGVKLWRAPVSGAAAAPVSAGRAFREAYLVTTMNPKSIAFFVAFVPQFLDGNRPFLTQAAMLVASFVALSACNSVLYAVLAGRMSGLVKQPGVRRGFNRVGGTMMVGAGIATAAMRRA